MIHYIYKIIFLKGTPENRYYYGKRSYRGKNVENDKYCGSGVFCKAYFEKYGIIKDVTYIKEIVEINNTKEINRDREEIIIGELWKTDPLCMNRCPGGGLLPDTTRCVLQYDIEGNLLNEFSSINDAAEQTGACAESICAVCAHKKGGAKGFFWRYKEDPLSKKEIKDIWFNNRPIKQYTLDLEFVKQWSCVKETAESLNLSPKTLACACEKGHRLHTAGGFVWCYYNDEPIKPKHICKNSGRKVKKLTLDSRKFIEEFSTLASAAKSCNGVYQAIQKCCDKINNEAYGFYWEYSE